MIKKEAKKKGTSHGCGRILKEGATIKGRGERGGEEKLWCGYTKSSFCL